MITDIMPATIVASNLSVWFDRPSAKRLVALNNIGFLVEENDLVCVVGSNGSGKTTLLKVLAGVLPPNQGSVWFRDNRLYKWAPHERCRRISRVTAVAEHGCAPRMTVEENLTLALLKGRRPTWRLAVRSTRKRIAQQLDELGMSALLIPRLRNIAVELSEGERQVLVLAMAVIQKPDLLLLDEHTAALDAKNRQMVNELTLRLVRRAITTVMISHDLNDALQLATKILILDAGHLVRRIQAEELKTTTVSDLKSHFTRARSGH